MAQQQVEDILFNSEPVKEGARTSVNMQEGMPVTFPTSPLEAPPQLGRKSYGLWILVVLLVVLGAGSAGWYATKMMQERQEAIAPLAKIEEQAIPKVALQQEPPTPLLAPVVAPEASPLDTDQDGLTDAEEQKLATDPQNTDTDNDGLSDFEEVEIWFTDPKNLDTDGDSYHDGDEVKHGYNPKGAGRL